MSSKSVGKEAVAEQSVRGEPLRMVEGGPRDLTISEEAASVLAIRVPLPSEVPLAPLAVEELIQAFSRLGRHKQDFLLLRFTLCETDAEAVTLYNQSAVKELPYFQVNNWKTKDENFSRAYSLMASRCIDWARLLVMNLEAGNAVLGALERRKLLLKNWDDIKTGEFSAKAQAADSSIERVIPKKGAIPGRVVINFIDLLPERSREA